ncbi:hypothetical protein DPMN_168145 [Dreissena polymorpha]|uniref:Uncharacterized protein n=1 Tax=Dreissena polymorpha TaxID=45954 RepID=A0A9D4F1F8_DREPO|nr:hypothetical protein DPMN_168145 [Dreissena polymorpha]
MSMSELARHSPQLDIRDFCRMSMSELARHSPQLDVRNFCRMSMSELAGYSPSSIFECRMSMSVPTSRTSTLSDIELSFGMLVCLHDLRMKYEICSDQLIFWRSYWPWT